MAKTRLGMVYFTPDGCKLAQRLYGSADALSLEAELLDGRREAEQSERAKAFVGRMFAEKKALLFFGATGIAVRMIAPYVQDKLTDSPVLVADDGGKFVIPLLSGHVGGANELARKLADFLGAVPVITTATDNHGLFAVDVFAQKNGLRICNREGIAAVSSKLLRGEKATIAAEGDLEQGDSPERRMPEELVLQPFSSGDAPDILIARREGKEMLSCGEPMLWLEPREYVLGVGCRRGKSAEDIEAFVRAQCEELGIEPEELQAVVSIDIKQEEAGLAEFARKLGLFFVTYSAEELMQVMGEFTASEFVASQVGVDNVCERAVAAYCGEEGRLLSRKRARDGITVAIGFLPWKLRTWR
ncbi:MAG: cobalt-precorrin 5A hydrolase [Lachnospiraceae bacterium]|nr:cobalt-precorrin 5A hydrolase [Lachnospiraceae bacterium]